MDDGAPPPEWLEAANLHATVAQLLSTIVHQVNNALQTIGGHAELLKTDPGVTETTRRRAGTITSVTDRTAEMLASFQTFTRPGTERRSVLNLRDVAARALSFRHYGLGRARIEATLQGVEQAPVLAERRPLTQAVLNVILNAEQALAGTTPEGRITIDVAHQDGRSILTVDDNGAGDAVSVAALRDRPGHRLGVNNRLGLGLIAATAIVERMGGSCDVSPAPAGGTRVTISLPAAAAE